MFNDIKIISASGKQNKKTKFYVNDDQLINHKFCNSSSDSGGSDGGGGDGPGGGDAAPSVPTIPLYHYITSYSGLYAGSLSAQGNMLAMQLNTGAFKYYDYQGNPVADPSKYIPPTDGLNLYIRPYLTGYVREYWRDPVACTFGNDCAIPALFGVFPKTSEFSDTPGNINYYIDLQISRLLGEPFGTRCFNQYYFYNALNQAIAWTETTNSYLAGLINSEKTNLNYYGFKNYDDLVTQGLNKYNKSRALINAFGNSGILVQNIPYKTFGTANGIVKSMIDNGLGIIGNLSQKLFDAGIIYSQISNPNCTPQLEAILLQITNPADLALIQTVLKTTVPASYFTTPLAYNSIESCSGLTNDSGFKTMKEVGEDLYLRMPNSIFTLGTQTAKLVENIQNETSVSVEEIGDPNKTLLSPEIIAALRAFLPTTDENKPISVLNVIGTAAGYYNSYLEQVNIGFKELLAKPEGRIIRTYMTNMSRYAAGVPASASESQAAAAYTPVPPPVLSTTSDGTTTVTTVVSPGGPGYWEVKFQNERNLLFNLLRTISVDPVLKPIVKNINDNYYQLCKLLNYEIRNYNKGRLTVSEFSDQTAVFGFVSSLPQLARDEQNIATDYLLYGIAMENYAGNLLRSVLAQSKNEYLIQNTGGKVTGSV